MKAALALIAVMIFGFLVYDGTKDQREAAYVAREAATIKVKNSEDTDGSVGSVRKIVKVDGCQLYYVEAHSVYFTRCENANSTTTHEYTQLQGKVSVTKQTVVDTYNTN